MQIIIIRPTGTGDHYEARLDSGRLLVAASRAPFRAAARQLLRLGYDPTETIIMRRRGSGIECLRSTIEVAAGLVVVERDGGGVYFGRWTPPPSYKLRGAHREKARGATGH